LAAVLGWHHRRLRPLIEEDPPMRAIPIKDAEVLLLRRDLQRYRRIAARMSDREALGFIRDTIRETEERLRMLERPRNVPRHLVN
jgi:hypothetical protein